ncbi:hypothetical protein GCM10010261_61880 [Streptomyces pilosus]|nr:hypothetical protein GCM10010261_61880 [Streptomyces pilosus]
MGGPYVVHGGLLRNPEQTHQLQRVASGGRLRQQRPTQPEGGLGGAQDVAVVQSTDQDHSPGQGGKGCSGTPAGEPAPHKVVRVKERNGRA